MVLYHIYTCKIIWLAKIPYTRSMHRYKGHMHTSPLKDKAGTYILRNRQIMMEVIIMIMSFTYIIISSENQRKYISITKSKFGDSLTSMQVPKPNIELYRQSFKYRAAVLWNDLLHDIKNAPNIDKFKYLDKKHVFDKCCDCTWIVCVYLCRFFTPILLWFYMFYIWVWTVLMLYFNVKWFMLCMLLEPASYDVFTPTGPYCKTSPAECVILHKYILINQ